MKKGVAIILSLLIAGTLAGCGKEELPETRSGSENGELSETSGTSIETEETADTSSETEELIQEQSLYERVGGKLYVGDEFTLGTYEQDNDLENGAEDIEWIVLEKTGVDEYLCTSKYVLDAQMFFTEDDDNRVCLWSESYLRKWLNHDFYNAAFSDEDKEYLVEMTTKYFAFTNDSKFYDTASDMVRVISYEEIQDTFPGCVKVTEYAKAQGAPYMDDTREHENCSDGWYTMSMTWGYDDNGEIQTASTSRVTVVRHTAFPEGSWERSKYNMYSYSAIYPVDDFKHERDTSAASYQQKTKDYKHFYFYEGVRPIITIKLTEK